MDENRHTLRLSDNSLTIIRNIVFAILREKLCNPPHHSQLGSHSSTSHEQTKKLRPFTRLSMIVHLIRECFLYHRVVMWRLQRKLGYLGIEQHNWSNNLLEQLFETTHWVWKSCSIGPCQNSFLKLQPSTNLLHIGLPTNEPLLTYYMEPCTLQWILGHILSCTFQIQSVLQDQTLLWDYTLEGKTVNSGLVDLQEHLHAIIDLIKNST